MDTPARVIITALLAGGLAISAPPAAQAATSLGVRQVESAVILDLDEDDELALNAGDGEYTGTLTVTNTAGSRLDLALDAGTGCDVALDPSSVEAYRQAKVSVKITGCDVVDGSSGSLEVGSPTPVDVTFDVTLTEPVPFLVIVGWFGGGLLVASSAMFLWVVSRHRSVTSGKNFKARWLSPIAGLKSGWSIDSWSTNITVVTTSLVALFGASNALSALLGSAPKAAVAHVLVAGLIASLLVSIGPVVVKSAGTTEDGTALGLIAAGILTLTGTLGLVANVQSATWSATDGQLRWWVMGVCVLLAVFLTWYSTKSLRHVVTRVKEEPGPSAHVTVAAAISMLREGEYTNWEDEVALRAAKLAAVLAKKQEPPVAGSSKPPRGAPVPDDNRGTFYLAPVGSATESAPVRF